jgi:hypothetical protein
LRRCRIKELLGRVEYCLNCEGSNPGWPLGPIGQGGLQLFAGQQAMLGKKFCTMWSEPMDAGEARLRAMALLAEPTGGAAREGWLRSLLDGLDSIKESEDVHYGGGDFTLRPSPLRHRLFCLHNLVVELVKGVGPDAAGHDGDATEPQAAAGSAALIDRFDHPLPESEEELRRTWRPHVGQAADAAPDRNMSWEPASASMDSAMHALRPTPFGGSAKRTRTEH